MTRGGSELQCISNHVHNLKELETIRWHMLGNYWLVSRWTKLETRSRWLFLCCDQRPCLYLKSRWESFEIFRRKFCESLLRKYRCSVAQTKHARKWSSFEHFVSDPFSRYIWRRIKRYIANFASLDRLLSTFENNFIWWSMNLKTSQKHRPCDGLAKNCIVDDGKFNPITTGQFEHI